MTSAPPSMLDYYTTFGISPVHQDIADLTRHLERRQSLYLSLGLTGATFRGSDVLEVGPGSGHNSLFVASQVPKTYTLLEPNPTAVREIGLLYDGFPLPHVRPRVIAEKLEDFESEDGFDIVICEGWLGSSDHEKALLTKLGGLVRQGGVLVVTAICPLGLVFNTLRKALCLKISSPLLHPKARLESVSPAFSPHLARLNHMSRSHADWMLDMVLSPAYFDICLTPEMVAEALGETFDLSAGQPRFIEDWRWYKSLHGDNRDLTRAVLKSYQRRALNFLDYQHDLPAHDEDVTAPLLTAATSLLDETAIWERGYAQYGDRCPAPVLHAAAALASDLSPLAPDLAQGVTEARQLLSRETVTTDEIAQLPTFAALFGRELIYLAAMRRSQLRSAPPPISDI